jgi:hypothetical protein
MSELNLYLKLHLPTDVREAKARELPISTCQLVVDATHVSNGPHVLAGILSQTFSNHERLVAFVLNPFQKDAQRLHELGLRPFKQVAGMDVYLLSGQRSNLEAFLTSDAESWYFVGSRATEVDSLLDRISQWESPAWKFRLRSPEVIPAAVTTVGIPVASFSLSHMSLEYLGPETPIMEYFSSVRVLRTTA